MGRLQRRTSDADGSVLTSDTNCMTNALAGLRATSSGVPSCSTLPRLNTTTRSAMSNASSCRRYVDRGNDGQNRASHDCRKVSTSATRLGTQHSTNLVASGRTRVNVRHESSSKQRF